MKSEIFSYRFAQEILQHRKHVVAWNEIEKIVRECPVYVWPSKSAKNPRLEIVQQLQNTYFDRRFAIDFGWSYHPLATKIEGSSLRADFRKKFGELELQVEVQFGNMARWYSDIFKFQAGYSQKDIQLGVSIISLSSLARRIDSNVVNFERAKRELPSAELSVTLPILMVGISAEDSTAVHDISKSKFKKLAQITGRGKTENRWKIVNNLMDGIAIGSIGPRSKTGPMVSMGAIEQEEENAE